MKVFIAGATGVIGRPLTARLLAADHDVYAMTRSEERAKILQQQGAVPVVCDVFDRDHLMQTLQKVGPDIVMHQLTELPKRIHPRRVKIQLAATNRLRTEGTQHLFDAALAAGAQRFIAQSIAFAYHPDGGGFKREEAALYQQPPAAFGDVIRAVSRLEAITLSHAALPGIVLRYGFFYGPGTVYASDGSFAEDVRHRRVPITGKGTDVFSFIHVDDAAAATIAAMADGAPGIYNIVDDEPAPVADWLPIYASAVGATPPARVPRRVARLLAGPYAIYLMCEQRGAANDKAKRLLGWSPQYSTWRSGFKTLNDPASIEGVAP